MFMENKRETKGPKVKSYDGVVSPINLMNLAGHRRHRLAFDPYASDSSDTPSPLLKFLRSVDSATSGASSPAFVTPVKVEEDVIVMDGISVPTSNKGIAELRMRSPLMSSNSLNSSFGKSNSTLFSSSSGSGGRRNGGENSKSYKNRLCHFWEASGVCQFGSECQFAHGKEELRHHRSTGKIKHEISKLNSSFEGSSPSAYGSKFLPNRPVKAEAEEALSMSSPPTQMVFPASPVPAKQLPDWTSHMDGIEATLPYDLTVEKSPSEKDVVPVPAKQLSDWTPQMDGIEATLPYDLTVEKSPSEKDVVAYIEKVLYGTNARKRLPVFVEICPDS